MACIWGGPTNEQSDIVSQFVNHLSANVCIDYPDIKGIQSFFKLLKYMGLERETLSKKTPRIEKHESTPKKNLVRKEDNGKALDLIEE